MNVRPMLRQLRHDVWATEMVIAYCRSLTEAQLDLTAPGTYGTMPVQFVHHGSDHRAHIGTILGVHGMEGPALDVWAYGREIGAIREKR